MDRYDIKAEIARRGGTLASIANDAALGASSCRCALIYPVPAANRAIAEFLGKAPHEVWPHWFDEQGELRPGVSSLRLRRSASSRKRRAS